MGDDSTAFSVRIGKAGVVVKGDGATRRWPVHTASLIIVPGRRAVRLEFAGRQGSVTVQLSRTALWRLTGEFHEQSILADTPAGKPPRKRS